MADLSELERAFVAADKAGNTEDAQAFATEIRRLRASAPPAPQQAATQAEEPHGLSGIGAGIQGLNSGLSQGIAMAPGVVMGGMLGAPLGPFGMAGGAILGGLATSPAADLVKKGIEYLIPNSTYKSIEQVPQELRPIARAGEVLGGSVLPAAAPFTASRNLAQVPGMLRPIVQAAREAPKSFAVAEAGGAFGAAQGAAAAELIAPGNPTAALGGEVVGGFVNPVRLATKTARRVGGEVIQYAKSFSRAGRESKAAEIINKALIDAGEDPAAIVKRLREVDDLGMGNMSAAQKADSPTLLAFEASMASKNSNFDNAMRGQTKENLDTLRKLIGEMEASGDPELLKVAAKSRENYFKTLLEGRMRTAQEAAQKASQTLGGDKAAASVKATEILENSLNEARSVERALWADVPKDHPLPGTGIIEAHTKIRSEMLPEETLPPSFVEQFVARVKDGNGITSKEVGRFRSQMLMKARESRGQKKWGDARLYEQMADGALADMADIPGNAAQKARLWSKTLNDEFTRTFAGDALAVKGSGAPRIESEAMLEKAFGGGGTLANKRFEQLQQASTYSGPSRMVAEQEEFLRAASAAAIDPQTGAVNPRSLEAFKAKNSAMLDRFPALKKDLSNAASAEQAFRDVQAASKIASKAIEQRTAFSSILKNENPADAVKRTLNSANPQRDYRELVKLANRGPDGSVDGLKAATLDYASRAATSSTGDFSFSRYRQILNEPLSRNGNSLISTMKLNKVMSPDEANRLKKILQRAEVIEGSIGTKARMDELIAAPDMLFDFVVRAVGANVGGASVLGQASGAPLVMAGAGSKVARNVFEKIPRTRIMDVLMEASKNPQLMAALLEKPVNPIRARHLHRQVNAFLIQAGLIDREDQNNPP